METLVWGLVTGIVFGVFLQQAKVIRFDKQVGALLLKDMTIFKYMMSAIIVAMIGTYILYDIGMIELSVKALVFGPVIGGGALFGVGWALAGYCPGTAFGAVGEGHYDAIAAIVGGIVGALLYAVVYPIEWLNTIGDFGKITLPDALGVNHRVVIVPVILVFVTLLVWFEKKKI